MRSLGEIRVLKEYDPFELNKRVIETKQRKVLENPQTLGGKKVTQGLTPRTLPPKSRGSVVLILLHCPEDSMTYTYDELAHMSPRVVLLERYANCDHIIGSSAFVPKGSRYWESVHHRSGIVFEL